MPVLEGTSYCVESLDQFMDRLDVDYDEIARSLPKTDQLRILEECNEEREENNLETVEVITELNEDEIAEGVVYWICFEDIIHYVLENRDTGYTMIHCGGTYRIVEIKDGQIEEYSESLYTVFEIGADNRPNQIGNVEAETMGEARRKATNIYGSPTLVRDVD